MTHRRFEYGQLISMATGYVFLVSACYWLSYWFKFGVPITNYLTVSEVLVRSVIPLLILSGSVFPLLFVRTLRVQEEPADSPFRQRLLDVVLISMLAAVPVGVGSIFYYFSVALLAGFFYAAAIGLAICAVLNLTRISYLFEISTGLSSVFLHCLVVIMLSAVGLGVWHATLVIDRERYLQFESASKELGVAGDLAYLGEAGDKIFLWSFNRQTALVLNASAAPAFYLVRKGQ